MTFEWIEHTGEIELTIEAASARGVLEDAMTGVAEFLADNPDGDVVVREIELEATDRPALLVSWLEELVYLAETTGFMPERAGPISCSEHSVTATVEGRAGRPRHLVKAVTYHDLLFERHGDTWTARVVLDV